MNNTEKMTKSGFEEFLNMAPFTRAVYVRGIELIILSAMVWFAYSYLDGWQFFIGFLLLVSITLIVSYLFWVKSMWKLLSIGLFITGIIGFAGVYWHQFIRGFVLLQVILLLIISLLFIFMPDKFQRE